mgnify:CR=1 FL=1
MKGRDLKPAMVEIRWREENDPRRLRRIAELLANILDTAGTPGEGRRS